MGVDLYKKRELVLLALYSFDCGQELSELEELVELIAAECPVERSEAELAVDRAKEIYLLRGACDENIVEVCKDYSIDRIHSVERNILRLAIFELLLEKNVPPKVVIAEARRLTKKFSTEEAVSFVIALLTQLFHAKPCSA